MRRYHYNTSLGDRSHVKSSHAITILFVLVFAVYFRSLLYPFMWHDASLILSNEAVKEGLDGIFNAFNPASWGRGAAGSASAIGRISPMQYLLTVIDYGVWGLNPGGYHLSNTILHLINAVLMYFFAVRLTDFRLAPLISAAMFAVHPVHAEAVVFVSARAQLLCSVFMLGSLLLYSGSGRPREIFTAKRVFSPGYVLSLLTFVCALLSAGTALTLPVIVAMYALLYEEPGMRVRRVVPFFALLAVFILLGVLYSGELFRGGGPGPVTFVLTAAVAVLDYIRLLVVPWPLKAFYPLLWHGFSIKAALAFALIIVSGLAAFGMLLRGSRAAAFALLWTYIALVPALSIGAHEGSFIAERYLYIPSIGAAILFGMTVTTLRRKVRAVRKLMPYVTVLVLVVFAVLTVQRNAVWSDEIVFFKDMVRGAPSAAMPHAELSKAYSRAGNAGEAASELEAAARLAGTDAGLLYEIGYRYVARGRYTEAADALGKAVELEPGRVDALNMLGVVLAEQGRIDEAARSFTRALELDPGSAAAARNLKRLRSLSASPEDADR